MPRRPFEKFALPVALSVSLLTAAPAVSSFAAGPAKGTTTVTVGSAAASHETAAASKQALVQEYQTFLKEKHQVSFKGNLTRGDLIRAVAAVLNLKASDKTIAFRDLAPDSPSFAAAAALKQAGIISGDKADLEGKLSSIQAVQLVFKASGLREVAYTYPADKVKRTLAPLHLHAAQLGTGGAQVLAAAVDTGIVPQGFIGYVKPNGKADPAFTSVLLGELLKSKGLYKRYVGYVSDAGIYEEVRNAYSTAGIVKAPELQAIGDGALKQDIVTGYTVRDARYAPNFVDALSLTYGHSDIDHAVQLIGLLRTEGLDAKVQIEPRTSAFIYLKEWGEPEPSENYEVVQIENGNYIEYAKEYNLSFEFANAADKAKFEPIILSYAKKNEENQPGLIAGSWWQPLYTSETPLNGYIPITNNKVSGGRYYIVSFSLNDKAAAVRDGFKALDPKAAVSSHEFYVDAPFYRYLNGESK
ncbi:hypothetical protein [Paenibacillus gansuensis]|uniref:SLH domain-containing protein n=1 Tax=Paenibacillus gansuensis TaxID=306542 RepID=A0ABW5PJM7_9BACL